MRAARGRSGAAPEGARLVVVDRDEPGDVEVLAGAKFDAVVDVATGALGWVRDALDVLAPGAGHWTFVSSINAYVDTVTMHQTAGAARVAPVTTTDHVELADGAEVVAPALQKQVSGQRLSPSGPPRRIATAR